MQRIDGPTRASAPPVPAATGAGTSSPGYFGNGDPLAGTPPTTVPADWFNMIQEELVSVILHANVPLDKGNNGQLLAALLAIFVAQGASAGVVVAGSEVTIPLPGGFFLKVGQTQIGSGANVLNGTIVFANPFPTNCFFLGGNADGPANPSWHPVVIMIAAPDAAGAAFIADSANVQQSINAGRTLRWIAIGN